MLAHLFPWNWAQPYPWPRSLGYILNHRPNQRHGLRYLRANHRRSRHVHEHLRPLRGQRLIRQLRPIVVLPVNLPIDIHLGRRPLRITRTDIRHTALFPIHRPAQPSNVADRLPVHRPVTLLILNDVTNRLALMRSTTGLKRTPIHRLKRTSHLFATLHTYVNRRSHCPTLAQQMAIFVEGGPIGLQLKKFIPGDSQNALLAQSHLYNTFILAFKPC